MSNSYRKAIKELKSLDGIIVETMGSLGYKVELTDELRKAIDLAISVLENPEREEATFDIFDETSTIKVNAQCNSCGLPVCSEDKYCSNCGRKFKKNTVKVKWASEVC